jgi:hypothetical protein
MFTRHEHGARAREKWAARTVARWRCGKPKRSATGLPKNGPPGLPVRHPVRKFIRVGQAITYSRGVDRLRRKRRCAICPRQKGDYSGDDNKYLTQWNPLRLKGTRLMVGHSSPLPQEAQQIF